MPKPNKLECLHLEITFYQLQHLFILLEPTYVEQITVPNCIGKATVYPQMFD